MKKCLFTIMLVSVGLGQDTLMTMAGTKYQGKMLEAGHYKVKFQVEGMKSAQTVGIETIKSLILSDGTQVVKNGYLIKRDYLVTKDLLKKSENFQKITSNLSKIGGLLIGVSGILLYSNNQMTLKDNASEKERKDFADKSKSNADLAFVLLTLGGALSALD